MIDTILILRQTTGCVNSTRDSRGAITYLSEDFHESRTVFFPYFQILFPPLFGVDEEETFAFGTFRVFQIELCSKDIVSHGLVQWRNQLQTRIDHTDG